MATTPTSNTNPKDPATSEAGKPSASSDLGASQVQKKVDADEEKGYHGTVPDTTPNENYTVAGRLANKPTPETSEDKE